MDEYFIVPKQFMENEAATRNKTAMDNETATRIQINKKPPEAVEVVPLDNLTSRILRQTDLSDWKMRRN